MPNPVPLATLLSWAWVACTIEIDNAVEAAATDRVARLFRISLAMWANGLRCIDPEGTSVGELRARTHADCNVPGLERWRWLEVVAPDGTSTAGRRPGYGSRRGMTDATVVRPTRAGQYAQRVWPAAVERIEERWRERFGPGVVDELRAALRSAQPAGLPWAPPEIRPTDGFRSRVFATDTDDLSDELPLVVLFAQALTAATLRLERDAGVSAPLGANLLRVIASDEVAVRDLPRLGAISKEAAAMAVSYLRRFELGEERPQRHIALTIPGLDALDGYLQRCDTYRDARLRAALQAVFDQPDALITGLTPPDGCWRADPPYRAQTQRLLADPTSALPWQPMVLHRGGWPDGC